MHGLSHYNYFQIITMKNRNYAIALLTLLLGACSNVSGPTYSLTELSQQDGTKTFRVSCQGLFTGAQTCMNAARRVCGNVPVRTLTVERTMRDRTDPSALVFQCGVPQPVEQRPAAAPVVNVAPTPAVPAPVKPVKQINLAGDALFAPGQATLMSEARKSLNSLMEEQQGTLFSRVSIIGYTDATGSAALNDALSQRRAQAVASYLRMRGLKYDAIVVEGRGSAQPVDSNETAQGRAKNRRVEIQLEAK